ncbi:Phosphoribosylformylglycinamidine synthase 2 [Limihaloglobus sulfuriphilus]|uniref:Phosphoribosylformylglycinamidine synthase subunit PurL n=1 Tax=Limihaloglobus sulfuriphilus TaxID=1851148 RepID=A0A1Q2MF61_9BACT|nr:phosphoribosylformylglycinamidine synthase subunit PurL [Limihaloglobus sulfuriphilus]AQQ70882.1 Phosphoribosylformylglycinamidine synthase 2 [Limihaloglobus sulfuriphilus]
MKHWRYEIFSRTGFADVTGRDVLHEIKELGIDTVKKVESSRVFLIDADFEDQFARRVAAELLVDPVCENYYIGRRPLPDTGGAKSLIEVHLKSGVTDPVAESVTMGITDMGCKPAMVRTARKYVFYGDLTDEQLRFIARRALANDCIEDVIYGLEAEPPSPHTPEYKLEHKTVPLLELDDEGLTRLSGDMDLFLDLREMKTIQSYFRDKGREPSDVELETLAQTWSEHCVHKTLKSAVTFSYDGKTVEYDNLLKETVFGATQELNKDWCISVFEDNAGVVEFDETDAVCFKVETHNHPSALDPYGGAATGIGGVIRDPMGTGLGAKPVANTDVFCFGMPDIAIDDVPAGVLHPKRIAKGVVSGVRDYGNRMGIPTVNGAVYFDPRYMANPLVFCGNLGLIPNDKCFKNQQPGDLVVVVGGRTGCDGIHGATFSSGQMTHEHENIFSHAVQIGNAIVEKKTLDTLLQARDKNLYTSITDCGAGGLSSAVGEMGEKLGVEVNLEKVPLKYSGLNYTEIWISEAQERMVIAVKPEKLDEIMEIFASEDVEATVIGRFTDTKRLTLKYEDTQVGELDMEFLHDGVPKYSRQASWNTPKLSEPDIAAAGDYTDTVKKIFSCYNVASKEWIIRQYDHEVQGGSVVKPLCGVATDGPSDAAVIRPKPGTQKGVALSVGLNPMYGDIDPYHMALSAIDEAVRNLVCVGGRSDRIALLDNFCWGNCRKPEIFGSLIRAAQACKDGAMAYSAPFISGKDSLNNEFKMADGTEVNIPATLLISAISLVDNIEKCVTMDFKKPGSLIYVLGLTKNELGGSHYYYINGELGANVPQVDLELAPKLAAAAADAISAKLVRSAHDCSEGGLAIAVAEMAFAGELGAEISLDGLAVSDDCDTAAKKLFSESNSRYVFEVEPDKSSEFEALMAGLPLANIGTVTDNSLVNITAGGKTAVSGDIMEFKQAWQKPLAW